jgi:hypothetical protein
LSDAKITFVLPLGVQYASVIEPSDETVTYDQNTRMVTWLPSVITPDTGFGKPEKKIYIQLLLTPSIIEVGSKPALTSEISFTAFDSYSGSNIKSSFQAVSVPITVQ